MRTKYRYLVAAGCSHTQGTAYTIRDWSSTAPKFIPASDRLVEKYGDKLWDIDYISNNLTYGGILSKKVGIEQYYNLGIGGAGIESIVRNVRNFIDKVDSLDDYLFIIQIPNLLRKEILIKHRNGKLDRVLYSSYLHSIPSEIGEPFLRHSYDEDYYKIDMLYELYRLKQYIESKKGTVRLIGDPFFPKEVLTKDAIVNYYRSFKILQDRSWQPQETSFLSFEELLEELKVMDCQVQKNGLPITLHEDGTLEEDYHWNENGNTLLAESIIRNFDNLKRLNIEIVPTEHN